VKEFQWDRKTPASAVDATARVFAVEPPDHLWIGEYIEEPRVVQPQVATPPVPDKWDPIIYAEYGDWQVEVARWE
jgi:hypothetical protein